MGAWEASLCLVHQVSPCPARSMLRNVWGAGSHPEASLSALAWPRRWAPNPTPRGSDRQGTAQALWPGAPLGSRPPCSPGTRVPLQNRNPPMDRSTEPLWLCDKPQGHVSGPLPSPFPVVPADALRQGTLLSGVSSSLPRAFPRGPFTPSHWRPGALRQAAAGVGWCPPIKGEVQGQEAPPAPRLGPWGLGCVRRKGRRPEPPRPTCPRPSALPRCSRAGKRSFPEHPVSVTDCPLPPESPVLLPVSPVLGRPETSQRDGPRRSQRSLLVVLPALRLALGAHGRCFPCFAEHWSCQSGLRALGGHRGHGGRRPTKCQVQDKPQRLGRA